MTINDGGPAFPQMNRDAWGNYYNDGGMSLRDWFAGQALAGMMPEQAGHDAEAARAYRIADAMLAARSKGSA